MISRSITPATFPTFEDRLLQLLRPHPGLQTHSFGDDDDAPDTSPALPLYHCISTTILNHLASPGIAPTPTTALAAALASLSSPADPWTTPTTRKLSQKLLATPALCTPEILHAGLLLGLLKPLFTSATPTPSTSRLAPSGRLAIRESTNKHIDTSAPRWQQLPAAPAILSWTLTALPSETLEPSWPLLIPPILTLIDSPHTPTKTRAIIMVSSLLSRLEESPSTSTLLKRTGLAPVFWDAVEPTLSYLPPLTPTAESLPLLEAAYPCLLALARAREPVNLRARAKLQGVLVREGFLRGLAFGGGHVRVVLVLVKQLAVVYEALGVCGVRHLQAVVPALAEVLASDTVPEVLAAAAETLGVVVRVAWVRAGEYVGEALRGVVVCWGRSGVAEEVKRALREAVRVLRAVVEVEEGRKERWGELEKGVVEVDEECFRPLFEV